jgi:hypothetical protein
MAAIFGRSIGPAVAARTKCRERAPGLYTNAVSGMMLYHRIEYRTLLYARESEGFACI